MATPFPIVYDRFLSKITDDMYMELTELETYSLLEELLLSAIPYFEFPRVDLTDITYSGIVTEIFYQGVESDNKKVKAIVYNEGTFNSNLSLEEIDILATYMVFEWVGQQLASIENTRMKYSGSDFKFTSQANHLSKLLVLKQDYERQGFHLQRLYKRRKRNSKGIYISTFSEIMNTDNSSSE